MMKLVIAKVFLACSLITCCVAFTPAFSPNIRVTGLCDTKSFALCQFRDPAIRYDLVGSASSKKGLNGEPIHKRISNDFQDGAADARVSPVVGAIASLPTKLARSGTLAKGLLLSSLSGAGLAFRQSWWCFPMSLALFPVYCLAVHGTHATTPSWWPMERLDGIAAQPSAALLIGGFLLSNLSYLISGLYLTGAISQRRRQGGEAKIGIGAGLSSQPLLGGLVLACGLVSLVYHTVQAIGPHHAVEALFYVDHGIAISSFFYFLVQCGLPSRKTLLIGTAGITLLAIPAGEAYAFLHSIWHFLSAGATVSWANDRVERRKQFIRSARRERKRQRRAGIYP
eukprot:CAMPEP_0197464810 /NCGR_PEP_ID=MMETSP1175-20131217/64216_1 /TAXON_ID=1003142 /ORGANISM="Triceratium dubium, Strain CCMP147" /LENGTH=339 /DNA_ID=CAMNT_0043000805 /DNA_START=92 /DNA_END=1111 /DNA_ORIENTATION=-